MRQRRLLYLRSQYRLPLFVVNDKTIVENPDAEHDADKRNNQEVKQITQDLANRGRTEHDEHQRVYRPWGLCETVSDCEQKTRENQVQFCRFKSTSTVRNTGLLCPVRRV